ncbi:MAG: molybdopterin-guanine dinucleotide biosynthesis protein B [Alphaproteobacteria bacterium]|nr:molybdopterin-guanine dinucleotide biosynthesis protein B [Alphaproteobacteria bacterium]MBF0249216.1 molybdopterin-guanine dinucleotide biosynthesis protein B [Alphaproteobacteria bacterium]
MDNGPKHVIGIIGWSGSGKTTLLEKLIPAFKGRGLSVSTMKHTHHDFDIDKPGKDSYRHREAGAEEVLVTSARRWALLHELRDAPEWDMGVLVSKMAPVDVLLIEGFKGHPYPKIEVHRPALGKDLLSPGDDTVVALLTDDPTAMAGKVDVPVLDLGDVTAVMDFLAGYFMLDK